ncbi:conserved hypothetical protein [Thiocapsa sp. KS1]|jgi:putative toxin-antitoxin system antitoxin component (TIGR02293 family)|nr:conserved hypothetical protein [Thiocapsa sp. KS1]
MTAHASVFHVPVFSGVADADIAPEAGATVFLRLGLPTDRAGLVAESRRGFPVAVIERLAEVLDRPQQTLLRIAKIAPSTLTRRRRSPDGRLSPEESDRVYRIAAAFSDAVDLFEGDASAASGWLGEPAKALGGTAPIEHLDTEAGATQVHDLIGRLEHGVYS